MRHEAGKTGDYDRWPAALVDPTRDRYVPLAMLAAGFVAAFIWAVTLPKAGSADVKTASLVVGAVTLIKTFILIVLAIIVAPRLGISFGLLRTGIVKFAAILLFTDAA